MKKKYEITDTNTGKTFQASEGYAIAYIAKAEGNPWYGKEEFDEERTYGTGRFVIIEISKTKEIA